MHYLFLLQSRLRGLLVLSPYFQLLVTFQTIPLRPPLSPALFPLGRDQRAMVPLLLSEDLRETVWGSGGKATAQLSWK